MLLFLSAVALCIPSSGTAKFLTDVNVRTAPSVSSSVVAMYSAGETVKYDKVYNKEGRTWISYIGASGNRRYCCAIDKDGSKYISTSSSGGGGGSTTGGATGIKGIPVQSTFSQPGLRISGCCFLAACVKGGCTTQAQCVNAFNWGVKQGLVRQSDAYVLYSASYVAQLIANHFGLTYHSDYEIIQNCKGSHFYVFRNGREFFNSAGLGYSVC